MASSLLRKHSPESVKCAGKQHVEGEEARHECELVRSLQRAGLSPMLQQGAQCVRPKHGPKEAGLPCALPDSHWLYKCGPSGPHHLQAASEAAVGTAHCDTAKWPRRRPVTVSAHGT